MSPTRIAFGFGVLVKAHYHDAPSSVIPHRLVSIYIPTLLPNCKGRETQQATARTSTGIYPSIYSSEHTFLAFLREVHCNPETFKYGQICNFSGPSGAPGRRGPVRDLLLLLLRLQRRGPVLRRRGPVCAGFPAGAETQLRQRLRSVVHEGRTLRQERAVEILRRQVPVVRVHVRGEVPGGPAQEEPLQEDQVVQEQHRSGREPDSLPRTWFKQQQRNRQAELCELLRESDDGADRQRQHALQASRDPCQQERVPSVGLAAGNVCPGLASRLFFVP